MFDSRFKRLLTALLVATWSPGQWCCCGAHATGANLDVQASEASCCTAPAEPVETARASGCCDGCEDERHGDEGPCGCLHGPSDASLPTVAAVTAGGGLDKNGFDALAVLPPALAVPAVIGHRLSLCRGSPHAPRARSLLSLHCQLTT